jgi:methyl-accepting chemotaxis protein
MTWTVSRRIGGGFLLMVAMMLVLGGVGLFALDKTVKSYTTALAQQQVIATNQLGGKGAAAFANVELLRYLITGDQRHVREWDRWIEDARRLMAQSRDLGVTPAATAAWTEAIKRLKDLETAGAEVIAAESAGKHAEALRLRLERFAPARERVFANLDQVLEDDKSLLTTIVDSTRSNANTAFFIMSVTLLLAMIAGGFFSWFISQSIVRPLRGTISTLASTSTEIAAAITQQTSSTSEEAAAVRQTAATVEEVKQTTAVTSKKAKVVADAAQKSAQTSMDGQHAVEATAAGIQESVRRMQVIAERTLALSEQSQVIGEINTTVKDLAEQSNILAVNAAIEAAKAGEAGKGFAVVAAEVKSLADQSKQATVQIREVLGEIQRATHAAVMASEEGVRSAEAGVNLATRSGESIRTLTESVDHSAQAAQQILMSIQQQAIGMDQIGLAMQNIQQASVQNVAATRQVERATQDLKQLAQDLCSLVGTSLNDRRLTA